MNGSFPSLNIIYGSGRNSSFVIQGTHHEAFLYFLKDKSLNSSITWNKINSSSYLLISYPSITQTQINHMLPTSFKFRVNSYIKTALSQHSGELKAKNQVLERNYDRATIHHFHVKRLSSQPFYLALKNRKLDTYFLFCFHF